AVPGAAAASDAATVPGGAAAGGEGTATRSLDEQIQDLKKDVVDLNKDLFMLEEELLFPANTQVAVFVSMDVGDFFALDSVSLKIDSHEVSNYLYTPREVTALLKGGVQRLYVGNLRSGQHELIALFNGKGPHERAYRRAASVRFEKGVGAKYLELKITDHQRAQQPEFEIKDWE
ncbi:MAG: AraC family transcriptional regulator, partial [Steroidobacteraceae bacterium]